jgi:hypothetical protein
MHKMSSANSGAPPTIAGSADAPAAPVHVDLLDEDNSIAGQKFCCLSFVSPEKVIKNFEEYKFGKFIDQYEWERTADVYIRFVQYLSYKYDVAFDEMVRDLAEFREAEKEKLQGSSCAGHYKTFCEQNEDELLAEFGKANSFQTAVRGVKIRGSYETIEEAQRRAEWLRKRDPHHSIYVGQVGMWMPFHPDAYKTGRVEHLENELNTLMHEKMKNETEAKEHFDQRVKAAKQKAIEENMSKAEATGNKLTQRLDDDGKLTGANTMFEEEVIQTYSGLKGELTGDDDDGAAGPAPSSED